MSAASILLTTAPVGAVSQVLTTGSGATSGPPFVTTAELAGNALTVDTLYPAVDAITLSAPVYITGDSVVLSGSLGAGGTLPVTDNVVELSCLQTDDLATDGGGLVLGGVPEHAPSYPSSLLEHSLRWRRNDGAYILGGTPTAPESGPRWTFRGGALAIEAPDVDARPAQFFFAPSYSPQTASLGLYYALPGGRTQLVQTFDAPAFPSDAPSYPAGIWTALVACTGVPLSRQLPAAAGAVTYALSTGALPAGVTLSSSGVLSGTPLGVSTAAFQVAATGADGVTIAVSPTFTLTVLAPASGYLGNQAPRWTTRHLRDTPVRHALAVQFDCWDPYQVATYNDAVEYSVVSGTLPVGAHLTSAGLLTTDDFLKVPGTYQFVLRGSSRASGLTSDREYTLNVVRPSPPFAVVTAATVVAVTSTSFTVSTPVASAATLASAVAPAAYFALRQVGAADTYWRFSGTTSLGQLLSVSWTWREMFYVPPQPAAIPANGIEPVQSPAPPASSTPSQLALGTQLDILFFAGIGSLSLTRDIGPIAALGGTYVTSTSFVPATGSAASCCDGGVVRSAAVPANWSRRATTSVYVGPTTTSYFSSAASSAKTLAGEWIQLQLPGPTALTGYAFDPTSYDTPVSWAFMGRYPDGTWRLLDSRTGVRADFGSVDAGWTLLESDDYVYPIAAQPCAAYRLIVTETGGFSGNTVNLSGFALRSA